MTTKRGLAASGLLVFISLAVASCGGQQFPTTQAVVPTTPTSARARLLAAVTRTTEARTAKLAIGMKMSGLGQAGTITVTGSGAIDLAHQRMQMHMASSGPASSGTNALSIEMRVIGSTAYMNGGTGWTSQTVASTSATTPMPTNYLDELQGIAGDVRVEGTELLRGVRTTRYGGTIDLDRAASRVGTSAQKAAIQQMVDQLHLPKIPVTVWIDDAGRLRKMRMVMDLGAVAAQFGAPAGVDPKIDMTLELYDFGAPVSVAVPPGAKPFVAPANVKSAHDLQAHLRDALTWEKVVYTDDQEYTADTGYLHGLDKTFDWGGTLKVVVGNSSAGTNDVLCLSESSPDGTYAVADVASGPRAGTYFSNTACPAAVNEGSFAGFGPSW